MVYYVTFSWLMVCDATVASCDFSAWYPDD